MHRIVLRKGRIRAVWLGHPWVFRGAIDRVEGTPESGDLVAVADPKGQPLGVGWWHSESAIAVRIVRGASEGTLTKSWLEGRFRRAAQLRDRVLPGMDGVRVVNSEGDGLPGITVDRFGDVATLGFTSYGAWRRREDVLDALEAALGPLRAIVEVDGGAPPVEGIPVGPRVVRGDGEAVDASFTEHGVTYRLRLPGGQKTGAYLDQRGSRGRVAGLAKGRRVLDLFSYHGGFALAAARAGASEVIGVDSSPKAVEAAQGNAESNGLAGKATFYREDVQRWLRAATGERFDILVLDPPPMARSKRNAADAEKKLVAIHKAALPHLAEGGLVLTCSCSRHVPHDALERIVGAAAKQLERDVQVLERLGVAVDHPVLLPGVEGRYLSALLLRVW